MRAEVRVDIGGAELGRALPVDGPVGEVADDALAARRDHLSLRHLGRCKRTGKSGVTFVSRNKCRVLLTLLSLPPSTSLRHYFLYCKVTVTVEIRRNNCIACSSFAILEELGRQNSLRKEGAKRRRAAPRRRLALDWPQTESARARRSFSRMKEGRKSSGQ